MLLAVNSFAQSADELNKKSKEYLDKGNVKAAIPVLKQAAEAGHPEAQYNLGYCYQSGTGVTQSDRTANTWYMRAATQGYKDAQFKIAYSYALGRGAKQDYKKAFYWSHKCAEQSDPECMMHMVNCYYNGEGTPINKDSSLVWLKRLAILTPPGNPGISRIITDARLNLALMYLDGDRVPKDLTQAYTWYLIYNESKRDDPAPEQQKQIKEFEQLEKQLSSIDRTKAKTNAEVLLKHGLKNYENRFKADL
jgi:FOG: TPR repeat, SEL1 subfamily